VRGVGDEHPQAARLGAVAVVGADHQRAGQLAVRAGRRLERNGRQSADLAQPFLQEVHQRQAALDGLRILQRVGEGEPRKARGVLVDFRVVFHRARAQRVETLIHRVIHL
jgi:hypothetical protein